MCFLAFFFPSYFDKDDDDSRVFEIVVDSIFKNIYIFKYIKIIFLISTH